MCNSARYRLLLLQFRLEARLKQLVSLLSMVSLSSTNSSCDSLYIILRFDDATQDHYDLVFPLLKAFNAKGVEAVPVGFIGASRIFEHDRVLRPIASWKAIADMANYGWDIAVHGFTHLLRGPYVNLNDYELKLEVVGGLYKLEQVIDMKDKVKIFVPPGTQTHQNPLGRREISLVAKYYDVLYINYGYNYPVPIVNYLHYVCYAMYRKRQVTLWAIPASDSDKWVNVFLTFVKRIKKTGSPVVITLFFHEIYEDPENANPYGFYVKRFTRLLEELYSIGTEFVTVTELLKKICPKCVNCHE